LKGPGISLRGLPKARLGSRAAVAIRPEEFSISQAGAAADNSITAKVESVEYYGSESLFILRTQDHTRLFVRAPGAASPGDSITVTVAPERVLAYPVEQAA
jgi:putative spermidine/putrescine transport system ATP-binding protein